VIAVVPFFQNGGVKMIEQLNRLIRYLAESDITEQALLKDRFDLIILAGNSLPILAHYCSQLMDQQVSSKLLISGGYGHGTKRLIENIKQASILEIEEYQDSESEAKLLKRLVDRHRQSKLGEIVLEEKSRNTGENAEFSFKKVTESKVKASKILLLQDPILLKRTKLTFQQWFTKDDHELYSFSPFIPRLAELNDPVRFEDSNFNGFWERDYFVSLVLGEIRRLHNTADGYGPNGLGFLPHVDLLEKILADYHHLTRCLRSFR